jgi:hypothetical protein
VYCVLCTVYCVLCTVYCVLCTVYCVLCTVYLVPLMVRGAVVWVDVAHVGDMRCIAFAVRCRTGLASERENLFFVLSLGLQFARILVAENYNSFSPPV